MRPAAPTLIAPLLLLLALSGCSVGGDAGGTNDEESIDPQKWFTDNCALQLSTTTASDKDIYAIKQGALVPKAQDIDSDSRDLVMSVYSYDDATASVEKVGAFDKDHPVCFRAGMEQAVTAVEESSGEEAEFYAVDTPDNGTVYVATYGVDFSSDSGLYLNASTGTIGEGYNAAPLEVDPFTPVNDEAKKNAVDDAVAVEELEGNEQIPG